MDKRQKTFCYLQYDTKRYSETYEEEREREMQSLMCTEKRLRGGGQLSLPLYILLAIYYSLERLSETV